MNRSDFGVLLLFGLVLMAGQVSFAPQKRVVGHVTTGQMAVQLVSMRASSHRGFVHEWSDSKGLVPFTA